MDSPLASLLVRAILSCPLWGYLQIPKQPSCLVGVEVPCCPNLARMAPLWLTCLSHLSPSKGCPQREGAKVYLLCPVWGFLELAMSFLLGQASRLSRARPVSPQKETLCWMGEVFCFARGFSSGLGLASCTRAENGAEAL